jgi:hypothetical protein
MVAVYRARENEVVGASIAELVSVFIMAAPDIVRKNRIYSPGPARLTKKSNAFDAESGNFSLSCANRSWMLARFQFDGSAAAICSR